jgi:hypothetical protein
MKTIVYKMILGRYEICEISDNGGDEIRIKFDESFDGKITLCGLPFILSCGVSRIPVSKLTDGEARPNLYTGGKILPLESFIVSKGAIIRKNPDSAYIRRVADAVDNLTQRVSHIEEKLAEIQDKITQKINF